MAHASLSVTLHFLSVLLNTLLANAIGWFLPSSPSCDNTAPTATLLASVVKRNG